MIISHIELALFEHHHGKRDMVPPLAEYLSYSKVAQARILSEFMIPHTRPIDTFIDLLDAVSEYNKSEIKEVVTKNRYSSSGQGVLSWPNPEMVYNYYHDASNKYPFVMQPRLDNYIDVKVLVLGDEFYGQKRTPIKGSFRANTSCGANSENYELSEKEKEFCKAVMHKGGFPWAYIDLLITPNCIYLSEICITGSIIYDGIDLTHVENKKADILNSLGHIQNNINVNTNRESEQKERQKRLDLLTTKNDKLIINGNFNATS